MKGFLICLLALATALTGCAKREEASVTPEVTLRFFNVGKADAILITWEQHAVMVDAGTNEAGELLTGFLRESGIEALDLLIITHFDKDHVGGADAVLRAVSVDRVLEPDYQEDSKQARQYRQALTDAGLSAEALRRNAVIALDGLTFRIDAADKVYEQDNDNSLVIRLESGQYSALLAGDAENDRLDELLHGSLALKCDILKVPHHGRYERLSPNFFQACAAKYAVISSSDDQPEDEDTLTALEEAGSRVLLTRRGDVILHISPEGIAAE